MNMSTSPEAARRINRTWLVQGTLATDAETYLAVLEQQNAEVLQEVCARAVKAARQASAEHRDPKPDFYAALFSRATEADRQRFLKDHLWTRIRSAAWDQSR